MASVDPHREPVMDTDNPYSAKRAVQGRVVCVLDARSECRGMQLEIHASRAVRVGEILELALTNDARASPGERVDQVAYIGFVEVIQGGVILVGDGVTLGKCELGEVVGFDYTHFPNHMNILVRGPTQQTGHELGVTLEDLIVFAQSA